MRHDLGCACEIRKDHHDPRVKDRKTPIARTLYAGIKTDRNGQEGDATTLYQTEAIVLSQNDLGEYDRVILLLTREEGLVRAVVKGARKPLSKLSAVTQPYSKAVFQLFRGRNLDRVTQVAIKTSYPHIIQDYARMVYAALLTEIVSQVMPERERNDAVFDFFDRVLVSLEERDDPWPVAAWGTLGILARAGFGPSFGRCAACGIEIEGPLYFSAEDGGVVCHKCRSLTRDPGSLREISRGTARTLEILAGSSGHDDSCPSVNARGKVREEAAAVLLQCAEGVLGHRPKSASLVERIEVEQHLKE